MPALLILAATACLAVPTPRPLDAGEVAMLLEIGVPEAEIVRAARSSGGFLAVDAEARKRLLRAGATPWLLSRIPAAPDEDPRLRELASRYDVFRDGASGISFIHPAGWRVRRECDERNGISFRAFPAAAPGGVLFVEPAVFVFVEPGAAAPPDAAGSLASRYTRLLQDRLVRLGIQVVGLEPRSARLAGSAAEIWTLEARKPDGTRGIFAFALRIDERGRVIGAGASAGEAEKAFVMDALSELMGSLVLADAPR